MSTERNIGVTGWLCEKAGGGGSLNANNSGAGGNGADGMVVVISS